MKGGRNIPDENALRLLRLHEYLRLGLDLRDAVQATNGFFRSGPSEKPRDLSQTPASPGWSRWGRVGYGEEPQRDGK